MVGWRSWAARSGEGLVDDVGGGVRWVSRGAEVSAFAIIMTIITVSDSFGSFLCHFHDWGSLRECRPKQ